MERGERAMPRVRVGMAGAPQVQVARRVLNSRSETTVAQGSSRVSRKDGSQLSQLSARIHRCPAESREAHAGDRGPNPTPCACTAAHTPVRTPGLMLGPEIIARSISALEISDKFNNT